MSYLTAAVIEAAKKHARAEYPKESCGVVFRGDYVPCVNIAADPLKDFEIASRVYAQFVAQGGVDAILHSHPDGPLFPTQSDMESQILTNVPWGIIPLDDERIGDPIMWGDRLDKTPLIGREFRHGISDCYSLIRDTFALGAEGLKTQGVSSDWPFEPRFLPEVPRDDAWWNIEGQDLYSAGLAKHGFRPIQQHDVRAGDGFLVKVRSNKFNHAGLLVTKDLILHHLPGRLSRREPAGMWGRTAELWVRHEVQDA